MNNSKIEYIEDTFEEYLGTKDHISASDLKNFLKSPKYFYYQKYTKKKDGEEARHFTLGSALHEVILQPKLFKTNYVVYPDCNLKNKGEREKLEIFKELHKPKKVIMQGEMDMIMKLSIESTKKTTLVDLIRDSYRELSCYTRDEKTGIKVRLRPDSYNRKKNTITDLKSCVDSSKKEFKSSVYSYGYSLSGAFYMDFLNVENYIFCALEKQEPHQVSLYALSDIMIEHGREQYRMALDLMKWSIDNNYWCDYTEFEILKECYQLENLNDFFDILKDSQQIIILG